MDILNMHCPVQKIAWPGPTAPTTALQTQPLGPGRLALSRERQSLSLVRLALSLDHQPQVTVYCNP